MSSKAKTILVFAVVLIALIVGRLSQTDWDKRAIDSRLESLAELIDKDGEESKFSALGKTNKMKGFFTQSASIEYLPGRPPITGGAAFAGAFINLRGLVESAKVNVGMHEIELLEGKEAARSTVTISVKATLKSGEDQGSDKLRYSIRWIKSDGEWLIAQTNLID